MSRPYDLVATTDDLGRYTQELWICELLKYDRFAIDGCLYVYLGPYAGGTMVAVCYQCPKNPVPHRLGSSRPQPGKVETFNEATRVKFVGPRLF